MKIKLSLVVLLACLFAHAEINRTFGDLPLRFEPAAGAENAKFLARGNGYTLFLTDRGAILKSTSATIHMRMAGGTLRASITPQEPLPGVTNYLVGNDSSQWRTHVTGFARVEYRAIYPGIDLLYYGNQQQLEYDFVVAPGADPRRIRIAFDGATNLHVDENGDLVLRGSGEPLRFRKPVLYQNIDGGKHAVAGHYTLHGGQVGFTVSSYDRSQPLVIDPVLVYSTFLGNAIYAITTDAAGNVYAATYGPPECPAMIKMNAAGTAMLYSTFFGGSVSCAVPNAIAVDSLGNVYATGFTESPDFPTVNPIQAKAHGPANAFVFKLSPDGSTFLYSTYLGGTDTGSAIGGQDGDCGTAIAVDSAGNAYVAGRTNSVDFPTVAPFQATRPGVEAAFVAKINPAGSALVYSTYLGGTVENSGRPGFNLATGIAVDSTGSTYVTGDACTADFPTVNPIQATNKSICSVFVSKFNPAGSALVYSTYLGGSTDCCGGFQSAGIAIDSAGNAYVAGTTGSADFPIVNAFQPQFEGIGTNAFISKLNSSGSALIYSTFLGTGGAKINAGASAIALDSSGNVYITGSTGGPLPIVQPLQATSGFSGGGGIVAELNAAGTALVYSTYFCGLGTSCNLYSISKIAVDSAGNTYFSGGGFPLSNAIQASGTGNQGNLAKISPANAAGLGYTPAYLNLDQVFVGTSATQTVTVLAAGTQPLNIASIAANGGFTQSNNCVAVLAAATTCTVNVTFAPTASGSYTGALTITSNAGNPQSVALTGIGLMPAVNSAAQNAANFSYANVAGSLATIFGRDLSTSTLVGDTVTVTGSSGTYPAPIFYADPGQLNFQIPWEVAGNSQVTLQVDSISVPLPLSAVAPGIFSLNSQGTGPGAIQIANVEAFGQAVFAQPANSISGATSQPVNPGQYITIFATGLGAVTTAPPADGHGPTGLVYIAATATVSIGGVTVTPSFAGLAPNFAGLYQVNALVPANATVGSNVPVFITVGGVVSNTVTIAIQ